MNGERTNTLVIRTPEGIAFALLLAGPVTRFLAWALDMACIMGGFMILAALLRVFDVISADIARALTLWTYFVLSIGYTMACEWFWRGQTLGKRVLHLRVMDAQGLRLRSDQIVIRNLLRFADCLPGFYLLGGLVCLASGKAQRLGDLAANTIVVRTVPTAEPDLDQLTAGKYNSFRDHPHLAARLRQGATPAEAGIALQALLRRNQLDSAARVELFAQIATLFRERVAFPPEAVETLSDEQYVRNVVDVLFRP